MRKRPLGNTGIDVSEIALGTWGLSGGGYGPVDDAEADRVIDLAVELGIDLFDTADVYGDGAMERRLGARLPKTAVIVTKLGTDLVTKPPRKRFDLDHLRPAFERSRERLGRSTIDVVLLHNPTARSFLATEAVEFLKELKRLGALRAWGVSAGTAEVAEEAARKDADVIELPYNLFWSSELNRASSVILGRGAAVLARSVLAHGLLTGTWSDGRSFAEGDHRRDRWTAGDLRRRLAQVDALRAMAVAPTPAEGQEPAPAPVSSLRAAALLFVLANQTVTSAVIGPRSVTQLEEIVADAAWGPPYLKDTVIAELTARARGAGIIT